MRIAVCKEKFFEVIATDSEETIVCGYMLFSDLLPLELEAQIFLPMQQSCYLYYIFVRERCTEAGEAAEAACGVPLGPG